MARRSDPGHPEPVEIDLGMQKAFEVQMVVTELLNEGRTLYLVDQSEIAKGAELHPKHCRVLVQPQDAERVREVFVEAGFLDA